MRLDGMSGCLVLCLTALAGCGGSLKVNAAKAASLKSVAVVGVCMPEVMGARRSGAMAQIPTTADVSGGIAEGLDAALPAALGKITVTPLSAVAGKEGLSAGALPPHAVCNQGRSPFVPKGRNPKPDHRLMAEWAKALGVDAVVAVFAAPGAEVTDGRTKIFAGSFNPSQVYVVDQDGEQILYLKVQGIGSWAEGDRAAAKAFAAELAGKVGEALAGR